jgi:hypothetical protein
MKEAPMGEFFSSHYLDMVIIAMTLFGVVVMGVSIEEAILKRRHN